jgi:putative phosphonate metabolism protein
MPDPTRYCLYFTPPQGGALDRFGSGVIGYDAYSGAAVEPLPLPGANPARRDAAMQDPRRYGFHATLKAPFRLRADLTREGLLGELSAYAARTPPVAVGPLAVRAIGRFLALVPAAPNRDLDLRAAEIVAAFDPFRAPMTDEERARRMSTSLSPRQTALLDRWGYPHVFEEFRFHMTLTGPLTPDLQERWLPALQHLARDLEPVTIDALTVLEQADPASRFRVVERVPLSG